MKLEVGKKYRTREGEVVTVERKVLSTPHSYIGSNQCSYTERGLWLYTGHSPCDLIEEIKETGMKLEVGKKYRTVGGTIVTVKAYEGDSTYPFRVAYNRDSLLYTEDGYYLYTKEPHEFNIIEEIKENTMFNEEYKYLCMDADGYNKAAFNRPTLCVENAIWEDYDKILKRDFFNLGDDWKESLREIVYNDDGSIYLRKPRYEFKVDDRVLVRGTGESEWKKRHFCGYNQDGTVKCYADGNSSFTALGTTNWDEIKPYVEED